MDVTDFFNEPVDLQLRQWLSSQNALASIVEKLPDLFTGLNDKIIQGQVDPLASIDGPVYVSEGSRVEPLAVINGPVIIGPNTTIRSRARLYPYTFVGADCDIDHNVDIAKSLCLDRTVIRTGSLVGNTVLGCNVVINPRAVITDEVPMFEPELDHDIRADAKKDVRVQSIILGDYVRIGAGCVIHAGTRIGPRTSVGDGCVLHGSYGPDMIITGKMGPKIAK